MLDISLDNVCFIIQKAREFHAKETVNIPDVPDIPQPLDNPGPHSALELLESHASDPTLQELRYVIDSLEPEQQVTLVALMWLGRGDYEVDEWESAREDARSAWTEHTAAYVIGTPLVADYLEEGLDELGYSCEEP